MEYTVEIAIQAKRPLTIAALERVSEMGGVATGNPGERRLETTMTVTAANIPAAIATAVERVTERVSGTVIAAEAMTTEEADRRIEAERQFVGVTEVAKMLGLTKQRISALLSQRADFPAPLARLASGPIWRPRAIELFAAGWTRKGGRPRKNPDNQRGESS